MTPNRSLAPFDPQAARVASAGVDGHGIVFGDGGYWPGYYWFSAGVPAAVS